VHYVPTGLACSVAAARAPQHDIYCVNHVGKSTLEIQIKYGFIDFLRKNSNIYKD